MRAPSPSRTRSVAGIAVLATLVATCYTSCKPTPPTLPPGNKGNTTIQPTSGAMAFTDVTDMSGIEFRYRNGQETDHCSILESLGGGIGAIDFDRDGNADLCMTGGGQLTVDKQIISLRTALFRNLGDFKFENVAQSSGIAETTYYSHGVAVADYDNDGFSDIAISGYGGVQIWINRGDGTFDEPTDIGIDTRLWCSCTAWGDLDGDGNLDLYVTNYVNWSFDNHPVCTVPEAEREICSPKTFEPLPDQVFYSNGDGTFREVTSEVGLREDGKGLGVVLADVDNDADLDIYVANDTTPNFLYLNDGAGNFTEGGLLRGVALDEQGFSNGSMGVDICDYNRDGRFDIFVANYEDESFALYRNEGNAYFVHVSQPTGVTALGELFVGFGSVCADFDRDADEDFLIANGHVVKYPRAAPRRQLPLYLENDDSRFSRVSFPQDSYFSHDHEGRGLAAADLDNNGTLDVAISHLNDPVALLRNDCEDGDWLAVELVGTVSNRDAVGARLILHTGEGDLVRQIKGGASYLSTNDHRVYWGFPKETTVDKLTIHWPGGTSQEVDITETGRVLTVTQASDGETD